MGNPTTNAANDIAAHLHPFTNLAMHRETGPLTIARGDGVFVEDDKGNRVGRPFDVDTFDPITAKLTRKTESLPFRISF